jgi:adenylate cyclase
VQDSIASELARSMQIIVDVDTVAHRPSQSTAALEEYLRGLEAADRRSREGSEAAVSSFQKALDLDPTFASAAVGLADAYVDIGTQGWMVPTRVPFERAREAALLAEHLDPKNPAPHVVMAEISIYYDWDWDGADRELRRAYVLGPRDTKGVQTATQLAAARGRWDEARHLGIEAIGLDPLSQIAHMILGWNVYLHTNQLKDAEQSFRRGLQISPKFGSGQYFLGEALLLEGRDDEALAEFQKETLDDGQLEGSAMALYALGRKTESDAKLAEAIGHNGVSWPSEVARVYAFRGEKGHAFEWLDRAYELRDEDLYVVKDDPLFNNLKGDQRFIAFLHKMNLAE